MGVGRLGPMRLLLRIDVVIGEVSLRLIVYIALSLYRKSLYGRSGVCELAYFGAQKCGSLKFEGSRGRKIGRE